MDRWLNTLVVRLDDLGVEPIRVEQFIAGWPDLTPQERGQWKAMSDRSLLRRVEAMDVMYTNIATRTDEDPPPPEIIIVPVVVEEPIVIEPVETAAEIIVEEIAAGIVDQVVEDGTVADVMAWVGGDPARARLALAAENAFEKPRAGLVARLAKLAR